MRTNPPFHCRTLEHEGCRRSSHCTHRCHVYLYTLLPRTELTLHTQTPCLSLHITATYGALWQTSCLSLHITATYGALWQTSCLSLHITATYGALWQTSCLSLHITATYGAVWLFLIRRVIEKLVLMYLHLQLGMLKVENFFSRYEKFFSRDSTRILYHVMMMSHTWPGIIDEA